MPISKMSARGKNRVEHEFPSSVSLVRMGSRVATREGKEGQIWGRRGVTMYQAESSRLLLVKSGENGFPRAEEVYLGKMR